MSKVTDFISKLTLSDKTKNVYKCSLLKIEKQTDNLLHEFDSQELFDFIHNLEIVDKTKRDKCYQIVCFFKTMEISTPFIKLVEERYANKPKPEAKKKDYSKYKLEEIRDKIKEIKDLEHYLLFNLLFNKENILRTDYINIKFTDISNSKIVIQECEKTKKKIEIDLIEEELAVINILKQTGKEYLLTINHKDRNNGYSKLLKQLSKLYFGVEFTQNDIRHLIMSEQTPELTTELKDVIIKLQQLARKCGTSVDMILNTYKIY